MSTKLYNAYICEENLVETYTKLKSHKKLISNIIDEKLSTDFIRGCIYDFDQAEENTSFRDFWLTKWREWNTKSHHMKPMERGENYSCSSFLFPLSENTTLIYNTYPTGLSTEITSYFNCLSFLKDYHYQNQTDKPSSITKEAWKKRKRDWSSAFGEDNSIWEIKGFSLEFSYYLDEAPYITTISKYVENHGITERERKHSILTNTKWQEFIEGKENIQISDYMSWRATFDSDYTNGLYEEELDKVVLKNIEV